MNSSSKMDYQVDGGSFRDPLGSIFYYKDNVYRAIDSEGFKLFRTLEQNGLMDELTKIGYVVSTESIQENNSILHELREVYQTPDRFFLKHAKVSTISYPYEWSYSMLRDAALLYLQLQLFLVKHGYSLKDGSAFNVQFVNSRPVFIDIPSIEKSERKDIWLGFGQFNQMFYYPLLLKKYSMLNLKSLLLSKINGIEIEEAYRVFGIKNFLFPTLFSSIFIGFLFNKIGMKMAKNLSVILRNRRDNPAAQIFVLNKMLRKIKRLSYQVSRHSVWLDYRSSNIYLKEGVEQQRESFVKSFLEKYRPKHVLDIGCNIGKYSLIASSLGSSVVAIDSDHDCIDSLYKKSWETKASVLPLHIDICNPSPAIGFNNKERKCFFERIKSDCVLALALVHHLLVTSRIPLVQIRDLFFSLTDNWAVVEFIGQKDDMFIKLTYLHKDLYEYLTLDYFISIFSQKFEIIDKMEIPNTERTIFVLKRK